MGSKRCIPVILPSSRVASFGGGETCAIFASLAQSDQSSTHRCTTVSTIKAALHWVQKYLPLDLLPSRRWFLKSFSFLLHYQDSLRSRGC